MSPLIKKIAIKFGLVLTAFSITSTFAIYVFNESWLISKQAPVVQIFAIIAISIIGVFQYKKGNSGYATFRESFSVFILPIIFQLVLMFGFNLFFYNVIDPKFTNRMAIQQYEIYMEQSEEVKDEQKKESNCTTDVEMQSLIKRNIGVINSSMYHLNIVRFLFLLYSVLGLVVAAVTKKNRPEFD